MGAVKGTRRRGSWKEEEEEVVEGMRRGWREKRREKDLMLIHFPGLEFSTFSSRCSLFVPRDPRGSRH